MMIEIILKIIAGLVLFLFAVNSLSETVQKALGENTKKWILKFTSNTFMSVITGIVVTGLLDSSSAVIIITIVFVNSKLLTFKQSMGIVLGANIGTTISSQIIAMDIGKYSPILLLIGFSLLLLSKSGKINNFAKVILYFGVLFFGLFTMEQAVEPLKETSRFAEFLKNTDTPLYGTFIGAIITLIIQSSSATVAMAILLTKKGLLTLSGAVAIMLGAELGTCSDTLLATINGSKQAIKTGLFHLTFNIISVAVGLLFFTPFVTLVESMGYGLPIERSVANAHMLFNIGGALAFVSFLPLVEKLLNKVFPEKENQLEIRLN
ncbi:Na/Pi cotransporter family protein [Flavobacterium sp. GCM10023249]|uniref:Na/Pi cotransporter family protein n=1 Tax=unclassified Flavobacterium TaxID=196869 RepID=UPI00361B45CF